MDDKIKELAEYLKCSISLFKYESQVGGEREDRAYFSGKCNADCEVLDKMVELGLITEEQAKLC